MFRCAYKLALLAMVMAAGCGDDRCEPSQPRKGAWFGLGTTELLPWSTHVRARYKDTAPKVCWHGLGSGRPQLGVRPDGSLVAFSGGDKRGDSLQVSRYEKGRWIKDRIVFDGVGQVSMAVGQGGDIVLVATWKDRRSPQVKRFNGSIWEDFGIGASGLFPGMAEIAVDSLGRPVAAWREEFGVSSALFLVRLDGNEWVELAGSASGDGVSNPNAAGFFHFGLQVGPNDQPMVVWDQGSPGDPPTHAKYLRQFDGTQWVGLAGSATGQGLFEGPGAGGGPTLAVDNSRRPVVAWTDTRNGSLGAEVRQYTGDEWTTSWAPFPESPLGLLSVAVDRDDNPIVAWEANNNDREIYLLRYDGADWVELNGSASGGGISNSVERSEHPAVVANDDMICVAWSEIEPVVCEDHDYEEGDCPGSGFSQPRALLRCSYY